jgi:hypothetical protein
MEGAKKNVKWLFVQHVYKAPATFLTSGKFTHTTAASAVILLFICNEIITTKIINKLLLNNLDDQLNVKKL